MKFLMLGLIVFSATGVAGVKKVTLQNLDFDYNVPFGSGTAEKISIGLSFASAPHEIQVERTQDSFQIATSLLDFSWHNPIPFLYSLESFTARKLSLGLGTSQGHFIEADELLVMDRKDRGPVKAWQLKGRCAGDSRAKLELRMLEDCRTHLELTAKKLDLPFDLKWLTAQLPPAPNEEIDLPADNLVIRVEKGDFYLQLYVKYMTYAGLRAWGKVQYEDQLKTIAIRVDEIKFGYLPVTSLVMRKLKELIKSPNVTVDPPWIRVNLSSMRRGDLR